MTYSSNESLVNSTDVGGLLHGYDSHVVFFIHPHKEIFVVVMEDASGVGPVSTTARGKEKRGARLLEEAAFFAEFSCFLGVHGWR